MDNYKKTIGTRVLLLSILAAVAAGLCVYGVFFVSPDVKDSFIFGFQSGAAAGCGLLAVFFLCRYTAMLRDEKKLKLEFNRENDERRKAIKARAGLPLILVTSVLMIIAGIISAYFSAEAFIALAAAAVCQLIISVVVKFIYMQKM